MKKSLALKTLVSVGLLVFLLRQIDFAHMLRLLASAQVSYLLLTLAAYIASQVISCWRWVLLARPLGFELSFKEFFSFYFIGMFFNLFAPSTVGGDVSRVYYLAKEGVHREHPSWGRRTGFAFACVVADRVVGMAVLVWMGAIALTLLPQYGVPQTIHYVTLAMSLGFVAAWGLLPLVTRLLRWTGYSLGEPLRLSLGIYWRKPSLLAFTLLLSFMIHFAQSWIHLILARALMIELPWSYCFILYPLTGVFSALPVSLNGIGLREGAYVFLLGYVGVSSEKALAFGLLWFFMVVLDSLIGGLVYVLRKPAKPSAAVLKTNQTR